MSVELNEGRVKVSYDLGSGMGSITSDKRHNDGKWKSFTMSRMRQKGTDVAENKHLTIKPSTFACIQDAHYGRLSTRCLFHHSNHHHSEH